ncbi:MAG TPA: sigma-70 family RNA polymerase sigma factor [candidate division Zixibacteria bacterium]
MSASQSSPLEDQLIREAKGGNYSSFEKLIKKYERVIYGLAYKLVKSHDAADEIAQQTFVRAFYGLKSFHLGCSFYSWIYRICMNLGLNYIKRESLTVSEGAFEQNKSPIDFAVEKDNPETELLKKELSQKIDKEINSLPSKLKAVWILRELEDQSYEQIAQTLKISKGTVMSRLFRARKRLVQNLKGYLRGD